MGQIVVNNKCTGHGRCYSEAPELLDADDEGFVLTDDRGVVEFTEGRLDEATAAVKSCPERAMKIEGIN